MIVTFVSSKGGAGKSTSLVNVAAELRRRGRDVHLIDTDAQGSLVAWVGWSPDAWPLRVLDAEGLRHVRQYDAPGRAVLVDVPGKRDIELAVALEVAGMVVVATQPSPVDFAALGNTLAPLREVMVRRPELRAAVLICRAKVAADEADARAALEADGWRVLPGGLRDRICYQRAFGQGVGVCDYSPRRDAAAAIIEVEAVVDALLAGAGA